MVDVDETREPGPRHRRILGIAVVLLAFLAYAPALANEFPFDDTLASSRTIQGGPDRMITEWSGPFCYFASHYWEGEERQSRLYRPVTILSYAYTYQLIAKPLLPAEWEAFPHHLVNLLLHALATLLVLWLMRDLGLCFGGAVLTAALFAVHALHSEVVAGIVGRAELFAFGFRLLGLLAYRRAENGRAEGTRPPVLWFSLSGLSFFLALCSKESAIAWLPFLPCYLAARAWQQGHAAFPVLRAGLRRMLAVCVPALVVFLALRSLAIEGLREDVFYAANPLYHESDTVRLLTAIKIWGYALYKCVAPFSLSSLYGLPALTLVRSPADPAFLGAAVVLLAWLSAALWRPARTPLLFISAAVFFGFSFITSNIPFAIGTIFGERLYYIPSLGACMLPALLLARMPSPGKRILVAACIAWMIPNIVVDIRRSLVWKDNQTLLIHDAAARPDCASLQVKAATYHRWLQQADPERKDFHEKEAWRLLRRGRALDPEYVSGMVTQATFHSQDGDHDLALDLLQKALTAKRLKISGLEASIRGDLGMLLIKEKKQKRRGLEELREAVRLRPRRFDMRLALLDHGMQELPPEELQQLVIDGLKWHPGEVMMGVMQVAFLHKYAELTPALLEHMVVTLERGFRAVPDEIERKPRYITARIHLADAYKALGRKPEARACYEMVLGFAEAAPEQKRQAEQGLRALMQSKR